MDQTTIYLILAAVFGLFMAWGIGANDVANAMATSVGARALTLKQAILVAAVFEFAGAFLAGGHFKVIQDNFFCPGAFLFYALERFIEKNIGIPADSGASAYA